MSRGRNTAEAPPQQRDREAFDEVMDAEVPVDHETLLTPRRGSSARTSTSRVL